MKGEAITELTYIHGQPDLDWNENVWADAAATWYGESVDTEVQSDTLIDALVETLVQKSESRRLLQALAIPEPTARRAALGKVVERMLVEYMESDSRFQAASTASLAERAADDWEDYHGAAW